MVVSQFVIVVVKTQEPLVDVVPRRHATALDGGPARRVEGARHVEATARANGTDVESCQWIVRLAAVAGVGRRLDVCDRAKLVCSCFHSGGEGSSGALFWQLGMPCLYY